MSSKVVKYLIQASLVSGSLGVFSLYDGKTALSVSILIEHLLLCQGIDEGSRGIQAPELASEENKGGKQDDGHKDGRDQSVN